MKKNVKSIRTQLFAAVLCLLFHTPCTLQAEDHVMAATKSRQQREVPSSLTLSLKEAQDYAVEGNRSLRNASLAVQEAYAQRWQTIAAMLPQVDGSYTYSNYLGYSAEMSTAMGSFNINMPNVGALGVTASVGINGQGVVGALLNNIAIDMKKLSLEESETNIRSSITTSYVSVLIMNDISQLLDSSLSNIQALADITQKTVDAGAAEQTTADQIKVRINTLKNNINSTKRNTELAINSLRVLLAVPAETELVLTQTIDELLSAETILQLLGEDFNISNNLNYQMLQKSTELAKTNVHMAAWAYGPTISLAYNYTNQQYYGDGGMRMTPPNLVQLSVRMPLWSSGKRAAGVIEKKIAYEEAKNTLAETTGNLGIQYQQLRFNLQNAFETYMNEKENIEVAERVFESTTNKFKWGAASNLELTNASNDLISAQSTYVQAVLTLANAQVDLEKFLNNK
ncbi:MAG: TolC family protein [Paludibacteraceae bacterium]|nr:TolC family protein [Paludibacteraceae bacterium]